MSAFKPEYIARDRVPEFFPGVSSKTLANRASLGLDPPYFRVGRRAFYRYEDLTAWLSRHPVKTKDL